MICGECGNLRELCSDPSRPWYPQRTVCYAKASQELTTRRYHKRHEKDDAETLGRLGHLDGVKIWVAPENLTPGDNFV